MGFDSALYERGYTRQDILTLFRFIDWLLALPPELEQVLWQEIQEYEEAQNMTYVTSVERIGMQKGMQQGLQQGLQQGRLARGREAILNVLEARFITVPLALTRRINALENDALLRRLHRQAVLVSTVEDFTRLVDDAWAECVAEEARETSGV